MAFELDFTSIMSRFGTIAGLEGDELSKQSDLVNASKCQLERLLCVEPVGDEYALCEYAAACIANYSYVCSLLARPSSVVTEHGLYSSAKSERNLLEAAQMLKMVALRQIGHLINQNDFVFIQV